MCIRDRNISQYNENAGSQVSTDIWNTCYAIISRVNLVIDKSTGLDYAEKTSHLGQARFLRALMYYELVRHFGDVPLVKKPVGLEESFTISRSPSSEVYTFVTSEFEALADVSQGLSANQNDKGRPTIYSAFGMAAKAYILQGNYSSAKPHLKSIIDSGKFSMQANYADIFMEANDNGPHVVFSVQYDKSVAGQGNAQPQQVPKMAAEIPLNGVTRRQTVSEDLYNSYEAGDLRRDLTVQNGYTSTEDGEFVALLGPSGCGKTSTLRMIVGLESITSGSILFDDFEINHLSPEHRNVAMAFESYALYPNFTIFENLAFPLEVKKNSSSEISKKVGDIAEMLQITNILELKPNQLSGGQQQRVSLGRALIRDPAVFLSLIHI